MEKQQEFEIKKDVMAKYFEQFDEQELLVILALVHDVIMYRRQMDGMLKGFYQFN